jgi:hypothetical protein
LTVEKKALALRGALSRSVGSSAALQGKIKLQITHIYTKQGVFLLHSVMWNYYTSPVTEGEQVLEEVLDCSKYHPNADDLIMVLIQFLKVCSSR